MIIGITRNNQAGKNKLSMYFPNKYGFKYIDVDQILEQKIVEYKHNDEFQQDWKTNRTALLKLRNAVDEFNKASSEYMEALATLQPMLAPGNTYLKPKKVHMFDLSEFINYFFKELN